MNVFMCFWISFIALLGWISEIRKKKTKQKKKKQKTAKTYTNTSDGAPPSSV